MPSKASCDFKQNQTFANVVDLWEAERKLMGHVQPYTAKKSAEKARLLLPWLGDTDLEKIDPSTIKLALIELGQYGGRAGERLSSSTLRAAHLAGTQAIDWAIENDLSIANPFKQVARPKANHAPAQFLLPDQASNVALAMAKRMEAKLAEGRVQQASFALAVCIAIAADMRRGEVFALKWEDVDKNRKRGGASRKPLKRTVASASRKAQAAYEALLWGTTCYNCSRKCAVVKVNTPRHSRGL